MRGDKVYKFIATSGKIGEKPFVGGYLIDDW